MKIYVITCEGFSKVGISRNAQRRLSGLQNASPFPLRLRDVRDVPDDLALDIEARAHLLLINSGAAHRGEWFAVPSEVAARAITNAEKQVGTLFVTCAESLRPVDTSISTDKRSNINGVGGGDRIRTCEGTEIP